MVRGRCCVVDGDGDDGGFDALGAGGVEFHGAGECRALQQQLLRNLRVLQQQNPHLLFGAQILSREGRWQCSTTMRHVVVSPGCSQVCCKSTNRLGLGFVDGRHHHRGDRKVES